MYALGLDSEVGRAEKIGVVGSPSSTSGLHLDVVASAAEKGLVGLFAFLKYRQDDSNAYAIGQINEVTLKNRFAEEQTMKSLTKERGEVPSITKSQDTHAATMVISAVFREEGEDGNLLSNVFGTVPSTGTAVRIVNQNIMDRLVAPHAEHVVRLGKVFGSDVLLPNWFRHFGESRDGGTGEAMHIGIFGKTGSGKSVLGKMIMLSYMRHETMSLLVLDPQGEFSNIDSDEAVRAHVKSLGKDLDVCDLSKLVLLPKWDLFKKILIDSQFLKKLGIRMDTNQKDAADEIEKILKRKGGTLDDTNTIPLDRAYERAAFDRVWRDLQNNKHLRHIYTEGSPQYNRVLDTLKTQGADDEFYDEWKRVTRLFGREGSGIRKIHDLLENINSKASSVTVINLSDTNAPKDVFWNEKIQKATINHILNALVGVAQRKFDEGGSLNTLVVLDEAHRLAPRTGTYGDEDASALRSTLVDAVRTTRKFGLGWMFISQTLASLDKELLQQLRIYFFGYGLAWGSELAALKELIGGNNSALSLYQQFHDPASSLVGGEYSFMSVGPSSPLAFSGMPAFFNSLQFPEEFIGNNSAGENNAP